MGQIADLPDDFGLRVRAARGYMRGISQANFGLALGMGRSYIKELEKGGKDLKDVHARGLVAKMAEISGLPESFFLGQDAREPTPVEAHLSEIEDQIRQLSAQTVARVAEVLRRIDDIDRPRGQSQDPPRP